LSSITILNKSDFTKKDHFLPKVIFSSLPGINIYNITYKRVEKFRFSSFCWKARKINRDNSKHRFGE